MEHHKTGLKKAVTLRSVFIALLAAFGLGVGFTPLPAAAEWIIDGNVVTYTDEVGFTPDGTAYSGTVSLRMQSVVISGQLKIVTTILGVEPAPGFGYVIKKNGGVNGVVEIQFESATCQSKFSFEYKPGLTRIDSGVMRCR